MATLTHLKPDAALKEIMGVMQRDAGVIIDNVISDAQLDNSTGGYVLGFFSYPLGPGEIAASEHIFGEKSGRFGLATSAKNLIDSTS